MEREEEMGRETEKLGAREVEEEERKVIRGHYRANKSRTGRHRSQ